MTTQATPAAPTQSAAPSQTSGTTTPSSGQSGQSGSGARRSELRQMSHAEGEAALRPSAAPPSTEAAPSPEAGGIQPFTPVRPLPGNEAAPLVPYDPTNVPRVAAPSGMGAEWGRAQTGFTPIAPPRPYDPSQPMQPIQADESQLHEGSNRAYGRGSVRTDPAQPSNDLRGALETRRTSMQAELTQLEAGTTNPGRRREQLQADLHQLDRDIASLQTGGDSHGQAAQTAAIAQRHGIDPRQLRNDITPRLNGTTVSNNASATGIGRTRTVTEHQDVPADQPGAGGTRETARSNTAAVTENGLVRSTGYQVDTTGADGATHRVSNNRQGTVGISNGGLGYEQRVTNAETTREADRSGVSRSDETTRHAVITQNGVAAGTQDRRTATVTSADGTSAERRDTATRSGSVNVDATGRVTAVNASMGRETRVEQRDAPRTGEDTGAVNRRDTHSATLNGGIVRDATTGTGVTLGVTDTRSQADRDNAQSRTVTGSATVTDRQVGANAQATGARNVGPVRAGGTFGVGGFYRIVANPVPDTNPPQYDLVTTLQYEVTVGGSLGNNSDRVATPSAEASESNGFRGGTQRSGSVSIGAERRVRRTNTFSHRMTQAELDAYQIAASRAASSTSTPSGAAPEIGIMTRINAARSQRRTPSDRELAGDPAIAASLSHGSSVENAEETRDTGTASARGTVGPVSGGVSVTRTHTGTVTRRTGNRTVGGVEMVEVTLTFSDETETTGSANASVADIGGTISHTRNNREGRSVVLLFDPHAPQYATQYREAYAIETMQQAEALANRTRSQITRSTRQSHTTSGGVGTMDNGAVSTGITQSERRQTSAEVTVGRAGPNGQRTLSGTTSGESESQLGANVRGTRVLGSTEQTTATNTVGSDGQQQVQINNTQSGGLQTPAFLQNLWRTTYQRMQSYDLDEGDISALVGRAGNAGMWLNSLTGVEILHVRDPWMTLRNRLVSPNPPREWREADPTIAMKLARGQAITDFIGSVGPTHGLGAMRSILRDSNPAHPLGVHWEWPDQIRTAQTAWNSLHAEVRGVAARFAGIPEADRQRRIPVEVARIVDALHVVQHAIEACTTFQDASAKVEMLDAIDRDIRQVERAGRNANRAPATPASPATQANASAATPPPRPPPAQANTPAQAAEPQAPQAPPQPSQAEREAEQREQREETLAATRTTLQRYSRAEYNHWTSAQSYTSNARGRWLTSGNDDVGHAVDHLVAIEVDWVGAWGAAWRRANDVARELGRPNDVPRNLRTNTNWRIDLLRQAVAAASDSMRGHYDLDGRINRWRSEDRG